MTRITAFGILVQRTNANRMAVRRMQLPHTHAVPFVRVPQVDDFRAEALIDHTCSTFFHLPTMGHHMARTSGPLRMTSQVPVLKYKWPYILVSPSMMYTRRSQCLHVRFLGSVYCGIGCVSFDLPWRPGRRKRSPKRLSA